MFIFFSEEIAFSKHPLKSNQEKKRNTLELFVCLRIYCLAFLAAYQNQVYQFLYTIYVYKYMYKKNIVSNI